MLVLGFCRASRHRGAPSEARGHLMQHAEMGCIRGFSHLTYGVSDRDSSCAHRSMPTPEFSCRFVGHPRTRQPGARFLQPPGKSSLGSFDATIRD